MTEYPSSPDPFKRAAREAGEALRRPAPADGVGAIRAARRRQQIVLGAAGATAVALVIGAGAFVMTRGSGDEQVATVADSTVTTTLLPSNTVTESTAPESSAPESSAPETTTPGSTPPTTTVPTPTSTAAPVAPATTTLVAWGDAQRAAGRTTVDRLPVEGGDGAVYLARELGAVNVAGVVALADGRVVEMPSAALPDQMQDAHVFALGDHIAVVKLSWGDSRPPTMSVLEPSTLTWSSGPDLDFEATDSSDQAWYVDGSILIGQGTWVADGDVLVPGADRNAVIVRPDLSLEQVATPPNGVQTTWSSVSGHTAYTFGHAAVGSSFTYSPSTQPWSFDVRTNTWSPVPNPDWLACTSEPPCDWRQPVEGGTPALEVGTDRGVVKLLPDGSVGLYDREAGSWRRLEDPPFELTLPETAAIGDLVVVAPSLGGASSPPPGTFATLDVVTGFWLTGRVELAADDAGIWLFRSDDQGVLLTRPRSSSPGAGVDTAHDVVVDSDTPTGRVVSDSEVPRWYPLSPFFDLTKDELA